MASITLTALTRRFGRTEAVHDLDLAVADGELVVIAGPPGSGRTTLLRMIAGFERPGGSEVRIGGRPVTGLAPQARDSALVVRSGALFPHMTVAANLAFALRTPVRPKAEVAARVAAVARLLRIENDLALRPGQLVPAQRQRAAIGRALMRAPGVLLLDEPFADLDAGLRTPFRADIRQLQRRLGVTMLLATGDQAEAMALADRLVVLNAGRVEQIGPPREVYARPDTTFVAAFIGALPMNFLSAEVLPALPPVTRLGIRAEHLGLVPVSAGRIDGTVTASETLGAASVVRLRLGDGGTVMAQVAGDAPLPPEGSVLGLAWEDARAMLFGPDGKRIPRR